MEKGKTLLYVITGSQGSGKTTLLHNMINSLKGKRLAVIQNGKGRGDLLEDKDIQLVEIAKDKLLSSQLDEGLIEILDRLIKKDLDFIFIERPAFEDSTSLINLLRARKPLNKKEVSLSGVILLVDLTNFNLNQGELEAGDKLTKKVKLANLIVLTKGDLISQEKLKLAIKKIKEINPKSPIKIAVKGEMDMDFITRGLIEGEEEISPSGDKELVRIKFTRKISHGDLFNFISDIKSSCSFIRGRVFIIETGWNELRIKGLDNEVKELDEGGSFSFLDLYLKEKTSLKSIELAWFDNTHLEMEMGVISEIE